MKTLKRVLATIILALVICVSAFADDPTPPPCSPGQMDTPVCAAPNATANPTEYSGTVIGTEVPSAPEEDATIVRLVLDSVLSALTLY